MEAGAQSSDSTSFGQDIMNSIQSLTQPLEMSELSPGPSTATASSGRQPEAQQAHSSDNIATGIQTAPDPITATTAPQDALLASPNVPETNQPESAIGPATDKPTPSATTSTGPLLVITLLLHSTETRHPYIIDESYLKRRNVTVDDNNPINMTVYTLKELILRDWRTEWEPRPTTPTSIRLIHMGRMLDDKSCLRDSRFSNGDTPHIVHMTIKPQEIVDEEDARIAKGGGRDRDGSERSPGCRCLMM